ncbi:MAG: alpha/beta fold hydrolase [Armatimonadetes bacterium]|nr:alpha/beta fold hydrolase [Armatimonadota bacterium]
MSPIPTVLVISLMCVAAFADGSAPTREEKFDCMSWWDAQGNRRPVAGAEDAEKRREIALARMQQVMGPFPGPDSTPPSFIVDEREDLPGVTRLKIRYDTRDGDRVPAYLFIPVDQRPDMPAALCLHQTIPIGKGEPAGLGGSENLQYALELARRGFITLAPDYPRFGENQTDAYALGYVSATMKGIVNHMRGVDVLQSLPTVDPERIACIGHSLGGHNTLFVTAFDLRIKVAVTSCGFCSFYRYMKGDLTGWSHAGYMPRIRELYGASPERMPFDFSDVLAAIAPRVVFTNSPTGDSNFDLQGVRDCIEAAAPLFGLLGVPGNLRAAHPVCGHDFPPEVREEAYSFIEQVLATR